MVQVVQQCHATNHYKHETLNGGGGDSPLSDKSKRLVIKICRLLNDSWRSRFNIFLFFFLLNFEDHFEKHLYNTDDFTLRSEGSQNIQWLKAGKRWRRWRGKQPSCFHWNGRPGYTLFTCTVVTHCDHSTSPTENTAYKSEGNSSGGRGRGAGVSSYRW